VATGVLKILVIEDDPDLGGLVVDMLRQDGHQVALAVDGATAVTLAQSTPPDAVLLDLSLPDILGYDLALRLRDGILSDAATIIMVTGQETVELDRANAVGIDIVLHKPIEAQLLSRLIEFVRTRRRRRFSLSPLRVASSPLAER